MSIDVVVSIIMILVTVVIIGGFFYILIKGSKAAAEIAALLTIYLITKKSRPTRRAVDVAYCAHCGGTEESHRFRIHKFVAKSPRN